MSIRWSLPLAVIAFGSGIYYFLNGNSELGIGLFIISVFGLLMQSAYLWSTFYVGKKNFRELALLGAVFAFVPALISIGVMLVLPTALALLTAYFASTVGVGLAIVVYTFVRHRPNREHDPQFASLGKHFSAMNLLATIGQQVDKLVVFHFLGAVDLAVYSFATALPEQIKNVFGGVSTLALPKFVARPFQEIRANFWLRLWLYTGLLAVAAGVYILIAPFIFKILFPQYLDAIVYSQFYALALIPMGNLLPATLLQAHTAKRELYILNVLGPVFQIGSLMVLTALYGIIGAIAARIAARAFSLLLGNLLVMSYASRIEKSAT
jgi:O-antigen/teichoic acid export membrane protein